MEAGRIALPSAKTSYTLLHAYSPYLVSLEGSPGDGMPFLLSLMVLAASRQGDLKAAQPADGVLRTSGRCPVDVLPLFRQQEP